MARAPQKEGPPSSCPSTYTDTGFNVGMVPNVGIIVGPEGDARGRPGMGLPDGQVVLREVQKVSKGSEIYIVIPISIPSTAR